MPWVSPCAPHVRPQPCPALPRSAHATAAVSPCPRVRPSVCPALRAHDKRGARGGETVAFVGSAGSRCEVWKKTLPSLGLLQVDRPPHTMPSFDEVLKEAGEFGRFQKRVFFLLSQTGITFSSLFASVVFLGRAPDNFWCRIPGAAELSERCGWTLEEERNFTVLPLQLANESVSGECKRLDVTWDSSASCSSPLTRDGNHSSLLLAPCHRDWVYPQPHSSIVSEVRKTPTLRAVLSVLVWDCSSKRELPMRGLLLCWLVVLYRFI